MRARAGAGPVHHARRRRGGGQVGPGAPARRAAAATLGLAVVLTREPGGSPGAEALARSHSVRRRRAFRRDGRGAAVQRRADRPYRQDDRAGAAARRMGGLRPFRRFDARLSGRRRPARPGAAREPRARRGRRLPARPDADPRPAGRRGSRARRGPARRGRRRTASKARASPFTRRCGRRSWRSRAPSRSAAWSSTRAPGEGEVAAAIWAVVRERLGRAR